MTLAVVVDRHRLARGPIADQLDADCHSAAAHLADHRLMRGISARSAPASA